MNNLRLEIKQDSFPRSCIATPQDTCANFDGLLKRSITIKQSPLKRKLFESNILAIDTTSQCKSNNDFLFNRVVEDDDACDQEKVVFKYFD